MSERDETVYVRHMLDSISRLRRHSDGLTAEQFEASELDIPWAQVTGLRHRLIHDYFGVDIALVWSVVRVEVPRIEGPLHDMLDTLVVEE